MRLTEEWRPIDDFPLYEVSSFGRVANVTNDDIVQTSLTQQGAVKVGLWRDGKQHTVSVKGLVARAFVPKPSDIWDTPMLVDGNQMNCTRENIVWRPRWYAWNYARQFNKPLLEVYNIGPIVELTDSGEVVDLFDHTLDVGLRYGLLFSDVWEAVSRRVKTRLTHQQFFLADKV